MDGKYDRGWQRVSLVDEIKICMYYMQKVESALAKWVNWRSFKSFCPAVDIRFRKIEEECRIARFIFSLIFSIIMVRTQTCCFEPEYIEFSIKQSSSSRGGELFSEASYSWG